MSKSDFEAALNRYGEDINLRGNFHLRRSFSLHPRQVGLHLTLKNVDFYINFY